MMLAVATGLVPVPLILLSLHLPISFPGISIITIGIAMVTTSYLNVVSLSPAEMPCSLKYTESLFVC